MKNKKIVLHLQGIQIPYFLVCAAVALIILTDSHRPSCYADLWMLPLGFGVVVSALTSIYPSAWKHFVFLFTMGLLTLRNVLTPFVMRFGDYNGVFRMLTRENVDGAIRMMLIESLFLSTSCFFYASQYMKKGKKQELGKQPFFPYYELKRNVFYLVVGIALAFLIFKPTFFMGFTSIFGGSEIRSRIDSHLTESYMAAGGLYGLFNIAFPWCYFYICLYLMDRFNRTYAKSTVKTILNFMIIIVPFFFMNRDDGFTIVCVLCLAFMALKTDGISKGMFLAITVIGLTFVIFYIFSIMLAMGGTLSSSSSSIWNELSRFFQAYFPGVCNFAGYFNIGNHSKLHTLFYDFYATIPGRNSLFGLSEDDRLVIMYTMDNKAPSQIIPCFCQLYHYLSFLAPIIECMFVKHSFKQYDKKNRSKNIYEYCSRIMLCVYLIMTPMAYNATIFFARYFMTLLPMLLLSKFVSKKKNSVLHMQLYHTNKEV